MPSLGSLAGGEPVPRDKRLETGSTKLQTRDARQCLCVSGADVWGRFGARIARHNPVFTTLARTSPSMRAGDWVRVGTEETRRAGDSVRDGPGWACADGRWGMSGDLCRQARRRMLYESRELTRVAGQVPRGELRHQPQLRGRPQRARRPRPLQARAAGLGPRAGAGYGQSLTRQRRGPGRWRASRSLEGAGVERVSEGAKG